LNFLIYDIEIKKAVPTKAPRIEGIDYCDGWNDKDNMGVSCVCAYSSWDGRYRAFMLDNRADFAELVERAELIVGHNVAAFDNVVMRYAWDIDPSGKPTYDTLVEFWRAAGLGATFVYPTHAGFGLDQACEVNFGTRKSGNGAFAPVWFQRGEYGKLIDYCMNDVALTAALFDRMRKGSVIDPRDRRKALATRIV
jgi:hypothetical protein